MIKIYKFGEEIGPENRLIIVYETSGQEMNINDYQGILRDRDYLAENHFGDRFVEERNVIPQ